MSRQPTDKEPRRSSKESTTSSIELQPRQKLVTLGMIVSSSDNNEQSCQGNKRPRLRDQGRLMENYTLTNLARVPVELTEEEEAKYVNMIEVHGYAPTVPKLARDKFNAVAKAGARMSQGPLGPRPFDGVDVFDPYAWDVKTLGEDGSRYHQRNLDLLIYDGP